MSFDHLGTLNKSQFDRFAAFARAQLPTVDARIAHLQREILRIGKLVFSYDDGGIPIGYTAEPRNSYVGRLVAAYEVLGGDVLYDLHVRTRAQAVFVIKADVTSSPQILSNGEVMSQAGLSDYPSARLMQSARTWLPEVLDYRREYLERKVRRAIDYIDQLNQEVDMLKLIKASDGTLNSLENIFKEMSDLFSDPTYRAISDDHGRDPFGKLTYAPFLPYEPGPKRAPMNVYGRVNEGTVVPGETGVTKT